MPDGIEDRNADVWEALLSIADAAGGVWPDRARVAAVALVADARGGHPSLGLRLLADLQQFFRTRSDAAWTQDIVSCLCDLEEAPWGDLKGKPLDARRLAGLLRPYGVTSKQIKIGDVNQRGYCRADLSDAWARYLPVQDEEAGGVCPSPEGTATAATTAAQTFFTEVEI